MKKLTVWACILMMGLVLLTGCGSDPVADELEKFINTDMAQINTNMIATSDEFAKWENFKTAEELQESLNNTILPRINDSLNKITKIQLETQEVQALKAKYETMLQKLKDSCDHASTALQTNDEQGMTNANEEIKEAVALYEEYNQAAQALAKEHGVEVEISSIDNK